MSPGQSFREFISERLTVAAQEIFGAYEEIIAQYEEEIDRQRKLLGIICKPEIKLHRIDFSQQQEFLVDQFCNQEMNSSVNHEEPKPPQIKEEQEDLCSSEEGDHPVMKQETDTILVTHVHEESNYSEPEPSSEQLLSQNFPESHCQEESKSADPASTRNAEMKPKRHHREQSDTNNVDNFPLSDTQCNTDTEKNSSKCDVCGKALKNNTQMKRHRRIHTGVKPHVCSICGKRFYSICYMKYHQRSHTGEKPYSCESCRKSFSKRGNLLRHMRTHTGEKPHSCEICGRSFSDRCNLTVHMRTHTGEKPYTCSLCKKTFSYSNNWLRHMRTHENTTE